MNSIDEQLQRTYVPPRLSAAFRTGVQAKVRAEKRKRVWEMLPSLVAPGAGVLLGGFLALLVPEMSLLALAAGGILGGLTHLGQLLFTWFTEELGEG